MTQPGVVIIGGGQAGLQVALSLRQLGFDKPIQIVSDEPVLPYQRPPLSKTYLADGNFDQLVLRGQAALDAQQVDVLLATRAEAIDRKARSVSLSDGRTLPYEHLVLATGTRPRRLPLAGSDLQNVHELRTLAQAERLRTAMSAAASIAIVGGGFIGLEVAAFARSAGKKVTVIEAGSRILERSVSAAVSAHLLQLHRRDGIEIRYRIGAGRILGNADGRVTGLLLADDAVVDADLVLLAAGAVPNDDLARGAGLQTGNGILVDTALRTLDPCIWAVGDCVDFPAPQGRLRLESVQNAVEQAKCVARNIVGGNEAFGIVPWFWSDQGRYKLQIAGLTAGADDVLVRKTEDSDRLAAICFRDGTFTGVETVNAPADHMAARTLLARTTGLTRKDFEDANLDLKSLVGRAA